MSLRCVYCGKYLTMQERRKLWESGRFQSIYSLRRKIFRRKDEVLKTFVIHKHEANVLLAQEDSFQDGFRFKAGLSRTVPTKYGVINGKIYLDDLPHDEHGCQMLSTGQINRLLHITPDQGRHLSRRTRERTLELYRRRCVRCGSTEQLEIHHRKWVVHGGKNQLSNLVVLCHHCHLRHSGEFTEFLWPDLEKAFLESEPRRKPDWL